MDILEKPVTWETQLVEIATGARLNFDVEGRMVRYAEQPITFEEFLDLSEPHICDMELINGIIIEKMSAQLTHEKLLIWLLTIANAYARRRNLGVVLGSRTAVEINVYGGRIPDVIFVRQDNLAILRERAIYGTPDLVIELVSPNDRPSDLIAVEADYRTLGLGEIVFIHLPKQYVRIVRRQGTDYIEETLTTGVWQPDALPGFQLEIEWLLREPRPDELDTLHSLLAEPSSATI